MAAAGAAARGPTVLAGVAKALRELGLDGAWARWSGGGA